VTPTIFFYYYFKEIEPEGQDGESTCSALSPVQGKKAFVIHLKQNPQVSLFSGNKLPTFGAVFEGFMPL